MSDAEDNTKTGDRESKDTKDKSKEDGHLDNEVTAKTEDGKDDGGKNKDKVTPSKKNVKVKNQKKEEKIEVKEEDEDENDDDEEEENETNGKVPLLDQPLQISGTRDRKKVQRFSEEFKPIIKESPKNEIPEGHGLQLREIPRIESFIQKHTSENLKPLYKVLFSRPGKLSMIKRNIRKFNGFDFKEGSDEYSKKRASITKLDMKSLKSISSTLALGSSGTREELVNQVLNFLMEPKDSHKPPLKDSKKKKVARSSSTKTKRKSSSTVKSKKKVGSDGDDESSEAEMEVDEKEDSEEEKKESSDEDEDSEDDKTKKKAPKKKPAANAKKPAAKKSEQKKEAEGKKAVDGKTTDKKKKKKEEPEDKDDDDESSEDEPLVKKTKVPPTDEEIKIFVKQILEGANLEEITMKTVCKQVYAAYPEFDLAHKKDFIKTTVKSLIST